LAETQRQAESEKLIIKKGEGFIYALVGVCWHEEAGGGLMQRILSD
jgi:hypothetical protein